MRAFLLMSILISLPAVAAGPETLTLAEFRAGGPPSAPLLVLGTFHFKDAGLDAYKPETDFDALSPARQEEIEEVIARLEKFAPKKIALEARRENAPALQERYATYRRGEFELPANEIYQLGFRLAKRLGHEQVYFVDEHARRHELDAPEAVAKKCGQDVNDAGPWNERFFALYRRDDQAKARMTLRETLLYMNSEERLQAGHGHYLVGGFHLGCGDDYWGADQATGWYNRNLRIFHNMGRLREPAQPMLLIIGAGHVPIIRHAAMASPEFEWVEVADVLGPER